ncbi:cytochrome P450 [Xylariaceae sp. FL1651]|nr:cytochrome P450 [Xylariaceae sp. FL1651]
MIPRFSGRGNLALEGDVDTCIVQLLQLVRSRYSGHRKPMDLAQKLQFFTLDVISTIGFGKCFDLLGMDEDLEEYLKSTHRTKRYPPLPSIQPASIQNPPGGDREAVRLGKAPPAPEIINYTQAKQLKYIQAAIREGHRIFPLLNSTFSRDATPEGDMVTIDGQEVYLPGVFSIIPAFMAMHRNKSIYEEDVDIFRPERWLEEVDEKKLESMKYENDLVFGHGQWLCLGKGIAMLEMSKVTFELLRNFH